MESISDVKILLEGFMQISLKKKFSTTMSVNELRSLNHFNTDSITTKENSNHSRDKNFILEMLEEDD